MHYRGSHHYCTAMILCKQPLLWQHGIQAKDREGFWVTGFELNHGIFSTERHHGVYFGF